MDLTEIFVPTLFGGKTEYSNMADFTADSSWRLQPGALDRAISHYNLRRPVVVNAATNYRQSWNEFMGCYTAGFDSEGLLVHCICVRAEIHPYIADEFLWHELCHAWQIDREAKSFDLTAVSFFHSDYANESRLKGYRDNKYEVEAREAQLRAVANPLTETSAVAPSCSVPLQILRQPDRVPEYTYDEGSRQYDWTSTYSHTFTGDTGTSGSQVYRPYHPAGSAGGGTRPWSGYRERPHFTYRPGHTLPGAGGR